MHALVAFVIAAVALAGCSTTPPPPVSAQPPAARRGFEAVQRVAVVSYGESRFVLVSHNAEPGRTFDEILKYKPPYGALLRPLAGLVHDGINWLLGLDAATAARAHVAQVSPRSVVAESLVRALEATGRFEQVRALDREPVDEDRRRADAIVRVAVPKWGVIRVRQGDPALVSAFADVQGQITLRSTGVVVWEGQEDVTGPERLPLESLTRDPAFAREQLVDVLAQAGRRLASELVYARSGP